MAIEYTWTFGPLETKLTEDGLTDVVKAVHWKITGVDSETGTSAKMIGCEGLTSPDSETFIAFDYITEENVKTWVLNKMKRMNRTAEEEEQVLKDNIATQIQNKISPPIVKRDPPWA